MITGLKASTSFSFLGLAAALATAVFASAGAACAQATYAVLYSFGGGSEDGANPYAGLIQGPDRTLYGTTAAGGLLGTVFKLGPDGSGFTLLHSFSGDVTDGAFPYDRLVQGPDGTLYGTTAANGANSAGTIFKLAPDGSGYTLLHHFPGFPTDGFSPYAGLVQGPDGTLYGTAQSGGASGPGTVFRLAPDGSGYTVLHSFSGFPTDGANPGSAGLIQGPDGTLYGTTNLGGAHNNGTVFQLAPDGSYTVLYSFTGAPSDGAFPISGLLQGPDGTLYGTTFRGGPSDLGTVFKLAPDGSYTVLHSFTGAPSDGAFPASDLIQGSDGTLYGTTSGRGPSDPWHGF